jgi:hypothetical protein
LGTKHVGYTERLSPIARQRLTPDKPKLLDQVRIFMRARRYSLRTEEAYLDWIRRFILFHGKRHPREMAECEIAQFLTHLAIEATCSGFNSEPGIECAAIFVSTVL